jgi:hypothetical protein
MTMNLIKKFCTENNIISDTEGALFLEGCGTILGFMYEFGFPYTVENFHCVKGLHDGTSSDIGWWNDEVSECEWISSLQSIKTFPTYPVLMEFKEKVEEVIHEWVVAR